MIEIRNLEKTFRIHKKAPGLWGSLKSLVWREWHVKQALKDVNLSIEQGEIVGLLGANGAGKTTLVKVLSGIINASQGHVRVLGFDPWQRKNAYRKQIALIMGQKAQLWWDLPAADCFLLLKEIYQIPPKEFKARLDELTDVLKVQDTLNTQIRRLSLGERMKMELIAALLHAPKVVFFDEPTIGLDISSQRALREFILHYHKEHRPTMIVTSHYMEDIESLCKRIVIMREGSLIYDGKLKDLVNRYAKDKFITVAFEDDRTLGMERLKTPTLSHLDKGLKDDWGQIQTLDSGQLKLHVARNRVSDVSSVLLKKFKVTDLTINEVDVASIVAAIQSDGKYAGN